MTGIDGISCRGQCRAQPCDDGGQQPLMSEPGARVREQDSSKTSSPDEVIFIMDMDNGSALIHSYLGHIQRRRPDMKQKCAPKQEKTKHSCKHQLSRDEERIGNFFLFLY